MRWFIVWFAGVVWAGPVTVTPKIVRQGETVRVVAGGNGTEARLNGRTVRLFPQADSRFGLMPIPVDERPGEYNLEVLDQNHTVLESTGITVQNAHYPSQNVMISQALTELKASPGETETTAEFRNHVSDVRFWQDPLRPPVPGCMTSPFGVKRLQNGKPTGSYHGGLDLRGAAGSPIRATAAGTVVLAREFALHGGTVGIDHGQGLESMYLHMSKIGVAEGAKVQAGDIIGYVGSTGRSNAPHLHWSIYVNGISVSPLQWVSVRSCYAQARKKK